MRELMELSGASQEQIERWQEQRFLPRFPRAYAGGGGSESALSEEIIERARLLAAHATQGASTMSPISLIATLSEPDVALLREALIKNLTTLRHRVGMDVRAASPQEATIARQTAADRKAKRQGSSRSLKNIATGPVKEGSALQFVELMTLLNRDTDEEIDAGDLEEAVDIVVGHIKENLSRRIGVPVGLLPPDMEARLRSDARRQLLGAPTFHDMCDLVRAVPESLLIRACRLVPLVRRVQIAAVESARLAHALHAGTLTAEKLGVWHDFPMPYDNVQRMEAHPMWERWGSKVIEAGAVRDTGDGVRIVVCLQNPAILDELDAYTDFLASLMPAQAFHRLAFNPPGPGTLTIK